MRGIRDELNVPSNVPAKDFWSLVAYDLESTAWTRDMPKVGIASSTKAVVANTDSNVDVYFDPEAPKGKESNWVPTAADRKFFLLFRFYGPRASCPPSRVSQCHPASTSDRSRAPADHRGGCR
ncbi:MAG: DUF1214 domain-containing protein [Planctomycetota bacterium]